MLNKNLTFGVYFCKYICIYLQFKKYMCYNIYNKKRIISNYSDVLYYIIVINKYSLISCDN